MEVLKEEPDPESYYYHYDKLDREDAESEAVSESSSILNQPQKPKDIDSVELVKLEADKAYYRIIIPHFGYLNKIDGVVVVTGDGSENEFSVE